MSQYSRVQFSDSVLLKRAAVNAAHDHVQTAELLADLAEIDARKLYLPAACPSMLVFCVRDLDYSEDEALTRIPRTLRGSWRRAHAARSSGRPDPSSTFGADWADG